jgi:hypothetical protein
MLDLGDTLTFSAQLFDKPGGSLVNATSVVLTITLPPDPVTGISTTVTPAVTNPPAVAGQYSYAYVTTTQYGRYVGRWVFTMALGQTSAYVETFDVQPTDPGFIVSLSAAKDFLLIPASETKNDDQIRDWLGAITRVVEDRIGVVVPRTVTDKLVGDYYCSIIRLRKTPVLAITSIVPSFTYGRSYSSAQVQVTDEGRMTQVNGYPFTLGPWTVVYLVGRSSIPPNVSQAAKIILSQLWDTRRGAGSSAAFRGGNDDSVTLYGYAVPNRALELLQPENLGPSVG